MSNTFNLKIDFNKILGDTIKEKMCYIKHKIAHLRDWVLEYSPDRNKIYALCGIEMMNMFLVTSYDLEFDMEDAVSNTKECEYCRLDGYKPKLVSKTEWGETLLVLAEDEKLDNHEMLIVGGLATARVKIINLPF